MATDDALADIRKVLLDFRSSVTADLEALHRHLDEVEASVINEVRAQGRRTNRLEDRVKALEGSEGAK